VLQPFSALAPGSQLQDTKYYQILCFMNSNTSI